MYLLSNMSVLGIQLLEFKGIHFTLKKSSPQKKSGWNGQRDEAGEWGDIDLHHGLVGSQESSTVGPIERTPKKPEYLIILIAIY